MQNEQELAIMIGNALGAAAMQSKDVLTEDGKPYLFRIIDAIELCESPEAKLGCAVYPFAEECYHSETTFESALYKNMPWLPEKLRFPAKVIGPVRYLGGALTKIPEKERGTYPHSFIEEVKNGPTLGIKIVIAYVSSQCDPKKAFRKAGNSTVVMRSSLYTALDILHEEMDRLGCS